MAKAHTWVPGRACCRGPEPRVQCTSGSRNPIHSIQGTVLLLLLLHPAIRSLRISHHAQVPMRRGCQCCAHDVHTCCIGATRLLHTKHVHARKQHAACMHACLVFTVGWQG